MKCMGHHLGAATIVHALIFAESQIAAARKKQRKLSTVLGNDSAEALLC